MTRGPAWYVMPRTHCMVEEPDRIVIRPLTDLMETAEGLFLHCNLPGVAQRDLDLTVDRNTLFLRGKTGFSCLPGRVHALEFGDVMYETRLALPRAVAPEGIDASLRDGVLTVFLPFPRTGCSCRIPVTRAK